MSDALFNSALGTVMKVFRRKGACTFRPMLQVPNREAEPDPVRTEITDLAMIFSEGAQRVDMANNGLGRNGIGVQGSFAGRYVFATIEAGALPYEPKKDDVILRDDGKLFRVAELKPDGLGGHILRLNEA